MTQNANTPAGAKFRENGIMTKVWDERKNVLTFTFLDGSAVRFDKRLVSQSNRSAAECHGWAARLGDMGAVEAKDFPSRMERSLEAKRRITRGVSHYQSASPEWDLPSESVDRGPTGEDLVEVLDRLAPGKGTLLFKASMDELKQDLAAVRQKWLTTKQGAKAWADIQAERKARRLDEAKLESADDMVAAMLAAAEGGQG